MINTHVMRSKPSQPPPTQPIANSLSTGTAAKWVAVTHVDRRVALPVLRCGQGLRIVRVFLFGGLESFRSNPVPKIWKY